MTGPLIFLSLSSEYLTNEELNGFRKIFAERVAEDVALGRALDNLEDSILKVAAKPNYKRRGSELGIIR